MNNKFKKFSIQEAWLFFVILSFCWERPIPLTGYARLNPTLYDIAFLFGLCIFRLNVFTVRISNTTYQLWKYVVLWFCFCSGIYIFLAPLGTWLFSAHFALQYVEGLLFVRMLLLVKSDRIFSVVTMSAWIGLIIVSVYCVYEKYHPEIHFVELTRDKTIGRVVENAIYGPFRSKFEMAQTIPLLVLLCLEAASTVTNKSLIFFNRGNPFLILLLAWPVLFSNSRNALFICLFSLLFYALMKTRGIFWLRCLFIITIVVSTLFYSDTIRFLRRTSAVQRFFEMEETNQNDSIQDRVNYGMIFLKARYDYREFMPLIGAGFNFAPIDGEERIGYGLHNTLLLPYEQAGVIGFILGILFLFRTLYWLYVGRKRTVWGYPVLSFFLALLLAGSIAGLCFWRQNSAGNVNTLIVAILCFATRD